MSLHEIHHNAPVLQAGPSHVIECHACGALNSAALARRLLTRSEVDRYLALSGDQVQSLVDTRQVTVIRIKGEERFDSRELDLFVETYKTVSRRRM